MPRYFVMQPFDVGQSCAVTAKRTKGAAILLSTAVPAIVIVLLVIRRLHFGLIKTITKLGLASLMVFVCHQDLLAQTDIKQIKTNEGLLTVRAGIGKDCYSCQGLFLNGKQILREQYVNINAAYPSFKDPQLVAVSLSNGGSCCAPTPYILDFSVTPHLVIDGFGFDKDISRSERGVIFTNYAGSDSLGDRLLGLYEYVWGSGKVILKRKTPQYTLGPLSQKEYPDDILSDPIMREPLLKLVGEKDFSEFRIATGVPDKIKIVGDNFVVGSGCQPHNCPFRFGFFVLDIRRKLAWAALGEEDIQQGKSARIWGIIGKQEKFVLKELGQWLINNQVPVDAIKNVSLPISIANLYATKKSNEIPESAVEQTGTIAIALNPARSQNSPLSPVELFKLLSPSIYIVNATRSNGDEFQGSAVAVSPTILLTNCHVVSNSSSIGLFQKGVKIKVTLISANVEADRCILKASTALSNYVSIRPYDDLNIGEHVYSIGAPAGLELTMTDGLLSGKRILSGRHLVQTSAPISPGSSGGGLFDEGGNLIGITTFKLKGSENLNFAISAGEYLAQ